MYIEKAPTLQEAFSSLDSDRLLHAVRTVGVSSSSAYLHWEEVRHRKPPEDLTHREWWGALKFSRVSLARNLPLTDPSGEAFAFSMTDFILRELHHVDQKCSGSIAMPEVVTADEQAKQHYLVNSLMEEAIRSSQLEGATTSRRAAKELLRSGREPKDRSERMILNNYRALEFMREDIGDRITPEIVLELQRILTEGTLDNPDAAGRLQRPDEERVAVWDRTDGSLLHMPPPADQLPDRLERMCEFANAHGDEEGEVIHPVIRAILLHFWLAYDHPFEDGNGRTARTLFYWAMRAQGYWLTEYLSISRILRNAPSKYARAFMLTETDEGDTTYFILYQLSVIRRAVEDLHTYLLRKVEEIRKVERLLRGSDEFNHRQLALLGDAIRYPDRTYTYRTHASTHNVTHETARADLHHLHSRKLLNKRRDGRRHVFVPQPDLPDRLARASRRRATNAPARATP
ncbi:MAG: Fic family protein [Gaiellales bacterium]